MLKLVGTATAAALFALASVSLAQAPAKDPAAKEPAATPSGPGAIPAKCAPMVGDEREKCLKEEAASAGATKPGAPSPGPGAAPGATTPSPMPAEPKKKE
jgi:hypothetical protein